MFYNQPLGEETITKEYKEFTFNHIGLDFDTNIAEKLVANATWVFNKYIENSIEKYLKIYIPKYTSAFMDSYAKTSFGELYIGIDNFGNVQGIPYQGELLENKINTQIDSLIDKYIISSDKEYIKKNIKCDIIKINYENDNILDQPELYKRYTEMIKDYSEKEQAHNQILKEWYKEFLSYTQRKLIDLFNFEPSRSKLYDYIKENDSVNPVLKMIDEGYQLEAKTHEEINDVKEDINEPYYWICKWKDKMVDEIKPLKPIPKHRNDFCNFLQPINILMKVNPMIPWWIKNNENINLYVIKITFLKTRDDIDIHYLDSFDKVNRCFRTFEYGQPCCTPL